MSCGTGSKLTAKPGSANESIALSDIGLGPKSSAALGTGPPASAVYRMAAARVCERSRSAFSHILIPRNALTYEGWPGASGWNNVYP